jgi:hypothetical protein
MHILHNVRCYCCIRGALLVVAAVGLAGPVSAQPPDARLRIPPDARGYQTTLLLQQYAENMAAAQPRLMPAAPIRTAPRALPTAYVVTISEPMPRLTYADLRGPDGHVRRFLLEADIHVSNPRQVIVQTRETATISVPDLTTSK